MTHAEIKDALTLLFPRTNVHVYRAGLNTYAEIRDPNANGSQSFTFAQMHALPEIFGTERLNFTTDQGVTGRTPESGSWGHWTSLLIEAAP